MVGDLRGGFDGVAAPFLHAGAVDVLAAVLVTSQYSHLVQNFTMRLTSKVIQEMGWSSGIAVLLTSSRACVSSSKETVKIAPGGVLSRD